MLNLVEKFTPASDAVSSDEGVVAVEYIIITVAAVAVLAVAFKTFYGSVSEKLADVFTTAP